MQKKHQVKLTLDEELYQDLYREAKEQGLSMASYLRLLICQKDLHKKKKNVKIEKQLEVDTKKTLKKMANLW